MLNLLTKCFITLINIFDMKISSDSITDDNSVEKTWWKTIIYLNDIPQDF